mmetsp:Transcript_24293/g.37467  ORF Transcript_24293/g.37467 Transcript_24293/m.37467 type:complete len:135 (-) Transcript_24293:156-560(-)|eukprot:CAMPEP_0118697534 /NCGR_PEP_ID=MMETSP0800-20121206/14581_1 /TAXON_ID=210618 ORGANISM="Striatella unipunctata, Strain CCMP2910" /NCGR_SAMPLE_ID=MMETSP0800 /ASSEMBLY_ACC=CAM_ASM_000638 /LENGTH=134 /DNA_ID=CAMNT_0006597019 /DNA_START=34 /DNA_END=438 /DNA_ORIENTATION=-
MQRFLFCLALLLQADAFVVRSKPQPTHALFASFEETTNLLEPAPMNEKDMIDISIEPKFHKKSLNAEAEPVKKERTVVTAKDEPELGYMEGLFRDLMFAMAPANPKANPTGFSGDIGDGPYDAYDVLAPKKWTP